MNSNPTQDQISHFTASLWTLAVGEMLNPSEIKISIYLHVIIRLGHVIANVNFLKAGLIEIFITIYEMVFI